MDPRLREVRELALLFAGFFRPDCELFLIRGDGPGRAGLDGEVGLLIAGSCSAARELLLLFEGWPSADGAVVLLAVGSFPFPCTAG